MTPMTVEVLDDWPDMCEDAAHGRHNTLSPLSRIRLVSLLGKIDPGEPPFWPMGPPRDRS